MSNDNFLTQAQDDAAIADDQPKQDNRFYADDVEAEAIADNNEDPSQLKEIKEIPVTSGEMEIGDLDKDAEEGQGSEDSYDEEAVPAGDNVVSED
ncbi:MAG: hypothetical protein WCJ58_04550 [bacterium]